MAQVLASRFKDLDALKKADKEELQRIDEVGPEVARSVVAFFAEENNRQALRALHEAGLEVGNPAYLGGEAEHPFQNSLQGLKFVFTGTLQRWTRDEAKELVERYGGRATSSVSPETDYVVAGPGSGAKFDKAKTHKVPVLRETEFVSFLEDRGIVGR
jgi:DNA ligase (NAD+)